MTVKVWGRFDYDENGFLDITLFEVEPPEATRFPFLFEEFEMEDEQIQRWNHAHGVIDDIQRSICGKTGRKIML